MESKNVNLWSTSRKGSLEKEERVSRKIKELMAQGISTELSTLQRSVVVGSLLGDGHVHKSQHIQTRNANFTCCQSAPRKEYVFWKHSIMLPFSRPMYEMKKEKAFMFDTICCKAFNEFYDLFIKEKRKIVPPDIVNYLDELALAIWYQDDGSIGRYTVNNSSFATCNCTLQECQILMDALSDRYGITKGRIVYCLYKPQPKYPILCYTGEGHFRLHEIVDSLLHPCFEYKKLPGNRSSETIREAPLTD